MRWIVAYATDMPIDPPPAATYLLRVRRFADSHTAPLLLVAAAAGIAYAFLPAWPVAVLGVAAFALVVIVF